VVIAQPIGVAGAVALAYWRARSSRLTTRAALVTAMVILALGAFALSLNATQFIVGIWQGALAAGIGLCVGIMVESDRSVWGPLGLATVLSLLSYLPA